MIACHTGCCRCGPYCPHTIVSLEQVASIEPLDTGDARVHMKDGANLPCSRTYRGGLRQRIATDA